MCSIPSIRANLIHIKIPTNLLAIMYVLIHTYMFRSPSATILRVYGVMLRVQ
jgi:hypothetical protein